MSEQHTPGPWVVIKYSLDNHNGIRSEGCEDFDLVANVSGKNHHANSCLIAAAPDLLAALRLALAIGLDGSEAAKRDIRENVFPVLRAAIARAEGRP